MPTALIFAWRTEKSRPKKGESAAEAWRSRGVASLRSTATQGVDPTKAPRHEEEGENTFQPSWLCGSV